MDMPLYMSMRFKEWLLNELIDTLKPPDDIPYCGLRRDAVLGKPQAFPTYDLPKSVAKRLRRAPPNDEITGVPR